MRSAEALPLAHGFPAEGRQLSVFALKAGMVLAAPIYTHQQIKVLESRCVLTQSVINRLRDIHASLASPKIWVLDAAPGPAAAI
jgi:hypothetical protein